MKWCKKLANINKKLAPIFLKENQMTFNKIISKYTLSL